MKRNGDIASLFKKHEAKKLAAAASSPPAPATKVLEEGDQEHESGIEEIVESSLVQSSVVLEAIEVEDVLPPQPPPPTPPVYDSSRLPHDPGERLPISSYPFNDQDAIRRAYIMKKPLKPINHEFPKRKIGTRYRSCSPVWLYNYD